MKKDKEWNGLSVRVNQILSSSYIPFQAGRPERDTAIGKDDVINLKIAIGTAKTIDEFIQLT